MAGKVTSYYLAEDSVPLPPPNAEVFTTACDYCIVGCGYKVYRWPIGREGGPKANQNALRVDFPTGIMTGGWVSPNMHNIIMVNGRLHHVVVMPDKDSKVVNVGGNHSIRGGVLAKKLYNPNEPSQDRLRQPMMRVRGTLQEVSWDTAMGVMAGISKHVLDKHGEHAWAMKTYSYQYFENTYAISKLAFRAIGTPAYSPHDKPGPGPDTPGIDFSGINPFSASYDDWGEAEVIFFSGVDPWETKSVLSPRGSWEEKRPPRNLSSPFPARPRAWPTARSGAVSFSPSFRERIRCFSWPSSA